MSRNFTRISAGLLLLFAMLACSIQVDPFAAPAIPSSIPASPATDTPVLVPPTLAAATNTPFASIPSVTLTPTTNVTATNTAQANPPSATPSAATVASPAIQKFKMVDASNGWSISDINVLRTSDGGNTWINVTPVGIGALGNVDAFFADAINAWVLSPASDFTSGTLYRTQDGGSNWSVVSVPFAGGDLKFIDQDHGFMLAALGAGAGSEAVGVYQSNDGGTTWVRNFVNDPTVSGAGDSLPLSGDKSGITFSDTTHGWVTGQTPVEDYVYFFSSADGGHTWSKQSVVLPPVQHVMMGAYAPEFFDQNSASLPVTIIGDSNSTVFFVTQDGGKTWMPTSFVPGLGRYSLFTAKDAFVWDGGAVLYVSHDGMLNWAQVHPNINVADSLSQMQFMDANTGWALAMDASSHISFYKTTDGGATWTAILP